MSGEPPSSAQEALVGGTVGPYRIEGVLGGGGMGHVFRAIGPDGTRVAVKMVRDDLATDLVFRKRFAREARIAGEVEHPHLVRVLDSGEHQGIPYLVQEFVSGGSLEALLKERGTLDVGTTARVCSDVAAGLDGLHEFARRMQETLVHRDVKSGNTLLDERRAAYLTDFGLAKDTRGTVLTPLGRALGTADYMAPEQIHGEARVATDVYALGCVAYECFCGRPPFAHLPGMRVLWGHLEDDPPDPCGLCATLPRAAGTVILSALQKDPTRRPQSAGELARDLARAAQA